MVLFAQMLIKHVTIAIYFYFVFYFMCAPPTYGLCYGLRLWRMPAPLRQVKAFTAQIMPTTWHKLTGYIRPPAQHSPFFSLSYTEIDLKDLLLTEKTQE